MGQRGVTHLGSLLAEPPQQQHHHVHGGSAHLRLGVRLGDGRHTGGHLGGQHGEDISAAGATTHGQPLGRGSESPSGDAG